MIYHQGLGLFSLSQSRMLQLKAMLICVWMAADPAHIPDDILPIQGRVVCRDRSNALICCELGPSTVEPVIFKLGGESGTHEESHCLLAFLELCCTRHGYRWTPKEPSPLVERAKEIGGCELLRVAACPVSLGMLKPALIVQCASGPRILAPFDNCDEVNSLRQYVAEELGGTTVPEDIHFAFAVEGCPPLADNTKFTPGLSLLSVRTQHPDPGETFEHAMALHEQAVAQEEADSRKSDLAAKLRARQDAEAETGLPILIC